MRNGNKTEVKLHVCRGPKDEIKDNCNHDWNGEFKESGCKDNKTYLYCTSCGLVCAVAVGDVYPKKCLEFRRTQLERRMKADCGECEEKKCNRCGLPIDLCVCKEEDREKKRLFLVNAEDFVDSHNKNCSECG